jgi:diadenosine tetraphosphate (Ap4A) HIT family hydrolase
MTKLRTARAVGQGRRPGGVTVIDMPPADRPSVTVDEGFQLLARMGSGRAIIGQTQFLPGYSLLLSDTGADRLSDLPRPARIAFLADMEAIGEAVERVCRRRDPAFRRINLEIQGNLTPKLHAHIWPRFEWEPDPIKFHQVARYPMQRWHDPATLLGPEHSELRDALRAELALVIQQNQLAAG